MTDDAVALARSLKAKSADLSRRALEAMYEDPFWTARFGDRGRRFSQEDGQYHVIYLIEALAAGDPGVLVRYIQWLSTVLVTRGMCSRHLMDHVMCLADAIEAEGIPDRGQALAALRAAKDALLYPEGPARAVQEAAASIAAEAAAALVAAHPEWREPAENPLAKRLGLRAYLEREAEILLSYLADAVHLADASLFARHVRWAAAHFAEAGASPDQVAETLAAIAPGVAALQEGEGARERAVEVLNAGRAACGEQAAPAQA
jgi:hypothetical protein